MRMTASALLTGTLLSPHDVPAAAAPVAATEPLAAEGLPLAAPQDSLAQRLSPDVRTDSQPLLDFKQTPPGRAPTGSVKVGF